MSQYMSQEYSSRPIVNLSNQPVRIALDVENCKFPHRVSSGKIPPHIHQILPNGFLGDSIPNIQRLVEISVFLRGFAQLLATDNVQSLPHFYLIRKMRTCQVMISRARVW